MPSKSAGLTLYDKIFESHVVSRKADNTVLLYIDRHMIHEVSSPQAFEGLRIAGRSVRRPECILATSDHNTPTTSRRDFTNVTQFITDKESRLQCETLERNVKEFNLTYFGLDDPRQGIVHVVGPEQGFTLPGATIVCGDSHTSTHGAFGSLAFGIGTSEVEHVLATQTLRTRKSKNFKIEIHGELLRGVSSKDLALHIIGSISTAGATGYVVEFCGSTIDSMGMEARMTLCNMSVEAGARAGLIAPDETTIQYIRGRRFSPHSAEQWQAATDHWKLLRSDADAPWDRKIEIWAKEVPPTVSWGTSPEQVVPISGVVPSPLSFTTPDQQRSCEHALRYMDLAPGTKMTEIEVDKVFLGSCTNSRIEDLRLVSYLVQGQRVPAHVQAIVVPGSGMVKRQAEKEGLDRILTAAGFEWRESGCSMCVGLNEDVLLPGQRCASTTNRNFEGRQGSGARTHLLSPAMAAAAALKGYLADVRLLENYDEAVRRATSKDRAAEIILQSHFCDDDPISTQQTAPLRDLKVANARDPSPPSATRKFTRLKGIAVPMPRANLDTDVILPKQFCKTIQRSGLAIGLFHGWRFDANGQRREEFILNQKPYDNAKIMIAGPNFGCGSSREHAPWALLDFGIRCIISTSFGEIFFNNAFQNGILALVVKEKAVIDRLMDEAFAGHEIDVDLLENCISDEQGQIIARFQIEDGRRYRLLHGIDEIAATLQDEVLITAFEAQRSSKTPWLDGPCTRPWEPASKGWSASRGGKEHGRLDW